MSSFREHAALQATETEFQTEGPQNDRLVFYRSMREAGGGAGRGRQEVGGGASRFAASRFAASQIADKQITAF